MHLVRTEFLKLRTTRLWWGLAIALLGLSALIAVLTLVFADETPGFSLSEELAQRSLFTSAGFNATFALVFGTIGMAGEYKQGTIAPTFLAAPQRWRVIFAYVDLAIKDVLPASEIFELLGESTATAVFSSEGLAPSCRERRTLAPRCRCGRPRASWRLGAWRCCPWAALLRNARTSPDGLSGRS